MPSATQDLKEIAENDLPIKSLDEVIAEYSTPEFTEALLDHFHEAKRRALADIRGAGLVLATEEETVQR